TVPGMDAVSVRQNVEYEPGRGSKLDVYTPPGGGGPWPAIVFVNGVGDAPGSRLKEWMPYRSWARLAAASGFAAVTFDARGPDTTADIREVFAWLAAHGREVGVDPQRLGVW